MAKEKNTKKKGIKKFFDVVFWIIAFFVVGFSCVNIVDKTTSYSFPLFGYHNAVVLTNSMSEVLPMNESYVPEDSIRIKRNDVIIIHEYKSYEEVEINDVCSYINQDGLLVCHRVIDKYETESGKYIITRGDNNTLDDNPFEFKAMRGKVVKVIPSIGLLALFFQSYYFLLAASGIAFFCFLGAYISKVVDEKEETKKKKKTASKDVKTIKKETLDNKTLEPVKKVVVKKIVKPTNTNEKK